MALPVVQTERQLESLTVNPTLPYRTTPQTLGDLQSLQAKGRRAIRAHLGVDVAAGVTHMLQVVELAVARG